ncbi:MAG: very short patch repair endonuclease [Candidatus Niyogibacteria bacterium CG10_big_fil_rev_8_21_14_0_10_42_19]|uniref:Very short patch repair endonuclease n=1 Tax=Candidatus Niyogibacteria bacterium CG10_big_fil_rev_8_21_14_0_10_42_19 TaxID=1974725 RepID=A0A2H0TFF4_9BACT|nr:MAG: very short patch repair endonuclease [Candidatus Niyogibacteria bacterium CG10_big_fil_rev_8_21_14_0_10_42_19]
MDHLTKKHRSWNMSRIRNKDTTPEKLVRKALTKLGYRYRLHSKKLHGKPDIVIPKIGTVLFINGCFWHQHKGCKRRTMPKTNIKYWEPKLKRNIEKQKKDILRLKKDGWKTNIIWECEVKNEKTLSQKIKRML